MYLFIYFLKSCKICLKHLFKIAAYIGDQVTCFNLKPLFFYDVAT